MPFEVVVVEPTHPLVGRALEVEGHRMLGGERCLLVRLPDGSAGTIALGATSAGGRSVGAGGECPLLFPTTVRRLRALLDARRGDHSGA